MESAGGLAAAYDRENWPTTLVIRGLSDPSDERKALFDKLGSGVVRRWAMYNASTLLGMFLRDLPIWTEGAALLTEGTKSSGPASAARDAIHQKLSAIHLRNLYRERPSSSVLDNSAACLETVTKSEGLKLDQSSYWKTLADVILNSTHSYPLRINGEPGTGKTTLLSTLYWYLFDLAEKDPSVPMPVYINVQHFDDLAYDDNGKRRPETEFTGAVRNELDPLIR